MSESPNRGAVVRRTSYKGSAAVAKDGRRKREEDIAEMQNKGRESALLDKRGQPAAVVHKPPQPSTADSQFLEKLKILVTNLLSNNVKAQLEAAIRFRKLLKQTGLPHVDDVVQAGVVPHFIEFLKRDNYLELQFEAAWVLTNIASGKSKHTNAVIESGAIPILVKLLSSRNDELSELAALALGNVASDSFQLRDAVLGYGALAPLLSQFNENREIFMLRSLTWTLSTLCRGRPQPQFGETKHALPIIAHLIHSKDIEVLTDACWTLSYLSDSTDGSIQAIIDLGVCQRLVQLLFHCMPSIFVPALRTIGNIVTGDDMQTQVVILDDTLLCLLKLLIHDHKHSLKKEACWIISNITAGNSDQIQAIIRAGIIAPLIKQFDAGFDTQKVAAWAISNALSGGTSEQIKFLVTQGCVRPLCDLLDCDDPIIVSICLEGLQNILEVGEADKNLDNTANRNEYAQLIFRFGGVKIEELQSHENNDIYEKALNILETYSLEEIRYAPSSEEIRKEDMDCGLNSTCKELAFCSNSNKFYRHFDYYQGRKRQKKYDFYEDPDADSDEDDFFNSEIVDRKKLRQEVAQYEEEISRPMGIYDISRYTYVKSGYYHKNPQDIDKDVARVAIDYYNRNHRTNYKFERIIKLVISIAGGVMSYITFSAKDARLSNQETIFRAQVWSAPMEVGDVMYCDIATEGGATLH